MTSKQQELKQVNFGDRSAASISGSPSHVRSWSSGHRVTNQVLNNYGSCSFPPWRADFLPFQCSLLDGWFTRSPEHVHSRWRSSPWLVLRPISTKAKVAFPPPSSYAKPGHSQLPRRVSQRVCGPARRKTLLENAKYKPLNTSGKPHKYSGPLLKFKELFRLR